MAVAALVAAALAAGGAAGTLARAPCWAVVLAVAALAVPLGIGGIERAQFLRRLVIDGVLAGPGRARRWLWQGVLVSVAQGFVAVAAAALLLAALSLLGPTAQAVLLLDAVLLALVAGPVVRAVSPVVQPGRAAEVARRWPLAVGNVAVLTVALFTLDYAVSGAPDSRAVPWAEVAEQAFLGPFDATRCAAVGALRGALSAVAALGWHLGQIAIPVLSDPRLRVLAWALLLGGAGVVATLWTRLLIGVLVLVEGQRHGETPRRSGRRAAGVALTVALAAALAGGLGLGRLAGVERAPLLGQVRDAARATDPCAPARAEAAALHAALDARLAAQTTAATKDAHAPIDAALAALAEAQTAGVDAYLDWYFTVFGEYQRLLALASGDAEAVLRARLIRHAVDEAGVTARLEAAASDGLRDGAQRLAEGVDELRRRAVGGVAASPCLGLWLEQAGPAGAGALADRFAVAVPAGPVVVAAGALAAQAARRGALSALARASARPALVTAARLAGLGVVRRAGGVLVSSGSAAALCAAGGPLALVCGATGALVAWVAIDAAAVEIREALFRDQMRADLLDALAQERARLGAALKHDMAARIAALAQEPRAALAAFVPLRDG